MAQLVHMDARLYTLNDELCQVNTCVGRIARRQVAMDGFTAYTSPSSLTSEDEVMMASTVMMLMRTMVLACPVIMRYLLDLLTLCHS